MGLEDIQRVFPSLTAGSYRITSPADPRYNCVAWAVREAHQWWDPEPGDGYYWPPNSSRILSTSNLIAALATRGYESCADAARENGFEKLAIYANEQGWPPHVARQLPSGAWTSKLGVSEDIEHASLEALEGAAYGRTVQFLKKPT